MTATTAEIHQALYGRKKSAHPKKAPPEKRTFEGYVFDSVPEMERYQELRIQQRAELITKLQIHTKFRFEVNGVHLGYYTADFTYIDMKTRACIVEDVKGAKKSKKTGKALPRVNREFGIKCKLMKALFGLEVQIICNAK